MSNTGTNSKPLPHLKKYHFNIIYNHEQSPLSATEDNQKSLQYAKRAVETLTKAGYDKSYYHHRDAIPGRNIFTELFRVLKESQFTLLIITPGFVRNCWAKYASLSAFKHLLDKKMEDHRLIALAFKLRDDEVPEELCQHEVLHFRDTEDDEIQWRKLKQVSSRHISCYSSGKMSNTGTNSRPLPPLKKYHFHIIYNHGQSPLSATEDNQKSLQYAELTASILTSAGLDKSYYHHRDARPGRNIFTELFRVLKESQFTLLIITPGFIRNCWAKYASLSAFKHLLDKMEDHRLIALAFKLRDDEVPEELRQHEVLHFRDTDDEIQWRKLKQVMVEGDIVATQEHGPITESGDNRLHTALNNLAAHPDGETSMSLRSLHIDGDRQGNIASGGDHTRGADSSPGQTGLNQRTPSLQIDGDDSVSGTADDIHPRQTTAHGTSGGLNAQRAATSGQKSEGLWPQQRNPSAAAPVVAKILPLPSAVGKAGTTSLTELMKKKQQ